MIQDMSLLETLAPREKSPAIAGMRVVPVAGLEVQPEAAVPGLVVFCVRRLLYD
jgi:hypothetical protein